MIKSIELKFGALTGAPHLMINDPSVTIFVGPNNSGKSRALIEIEQFCQEGRINTSNKILGNAKFSAGGEQFARDEANRLQAPLLPGETLASDYIPISILGNRQHLPKNQFLSALKNPNEAPHIFAQWYLRFQTLSLNGATRINLVNHQTRGNLLNPTSSFQHIFTDDIKRAHLREIVFDAFHLYFTLDASNGDQLGIRLSSEAPKHNERALTDDVLTYLKSATPIEEFSDGVKAFTGIMTSLIAGEPHIVLIDEPEAFLHPSLAFKLGKEVARAVLSAGKKLFAATHSRQFVMGAIQSGAPVNIVRLTYRENVGTARLLPNDQVTTLMRNPLLRSVGVMSGLFYENVVVTEADADRAFYQEINERLLATDPSRGIPNALFLNAQNKQTIPSIVAPLRRLGIAAASVADIDVLRDGGREWTKHLAAVSVPSSEHQPLSLSRNAIWTLLEQTGKNPKRDGGITLLQKEDREAANNLMDRLQEYGMFVVRGGEIEAWLSNLNVSRDKHVWLTSIFEKMGEIPSSPDYVNPANGDVWEFVESMRKWFVNSNRKGIPSD